MEDDWEKVHRECDESSHDRDHAGDQYDSTRTFACVVDGGRRFRHRDGDGGRGGGEQRALLCFQGHRLCNLRTQELQLTLAEKQTQGEQRHDGETDEAEPHLTAAVT